MQGGMRIDRYEWRGGSEALLRFGPDACARVVLAMPLFEEANRMRAFAVSLLRALAERGIASVLPDLPGMGESLIRTADARLGPMREALASLIGPETFVVALRSGAMLDVEAIPAARWQLSPVDGTTLLRERARFADDDLPALVEELAAAEPKPARVVRLESDPRPADRHVAGGPLWRRAEPGNDVTLAELLAEDISDWIARCDG